MLKDTIVLALVFAAVTALAAALGAVNLGTAMTFGAVAFSAVLVALLARR